MGEKTLGDEMKSWITGNWRAWIMRGAFSIAMLLIGYALGIYTTGNRSIAVVHAQATTQATTYVNMPKAWGPMVGTMTGVLVFQDRTGTIRLVAADTGAVGEVITRN
jgi:hypothetical protein